MRLLKMQKWKQNKATIGRQQTKSKRMKILPYISETDSFCLVWTINATHTYQKPQSNHTFSENVS